MDGTHASSLLPFGQRAQQARHCLDVTALYLLHPLIAAGATLLECYSSSLVTSVNRSNLDIAYLLQQSTCYACQLQQPDVWLVVAALYLIGLPSSASWTPLRALQA